MQGQRRRAMASPSFVCNRIDKSQNIQDDVEKKILACILSYITHLMDFKDQHSMYSASSARKHRIPCIWYQKALRRFYDTESNRQSDGNIHLLTSCVVLLTLHADDFRTNPTDIAKDLKMSEVKRSFCETGVQALRENMNNMLFATLPIPLHFPEAKPRRRR